MENSNILENEPKMVKLVLTLEDGEDVCVETPWAKEVGPGEFELCNLPWYVYDLSLGDVVEATEENGQLHFRKIISKSGNRTVRVIFEPGVDRSEKSKSVLDKLVEMGCSYEGATPSYIAINIPDGIDLMCIYGYLESAEYEWEYADPSWKRRSG